MNNMDVRDIAVWVAMGILAGWIASWFVGGAIGILGYLGAGLLGSVVGGYLARQFNIKLNIGSVFVEQMIMSIAGAVIVLLIARIIF